jgi:hypothetical protein
MILLKRKYRTKKDCIHWQVKIHGCPECKAKLGVWYCVGITACMKHGGWFKEKSK